jgi:hypothetical protein
MHSDLVNVVEYLLLISNLSPLLIAVLSLSLSVPLISVVRQTYSLVSK